MKSFQLRNSNSLKTSRISIKHNSIFSTLSTTRNRNYNNYNNFYNFKRTFVSTLKNQPTKNYIPYNLNTILQLEINRPKQSNNSCTNFDINRIKLNLKKESQNLDSIQKMLSTLNTHIHKNPTSLFDFKTSRSNIKNDNLNKNIVNRIRKNLLYDEIYDYSIKSTNNYFQITSENDDKKETKQKKQSNDNLKENNNNNIYNRNNLITFSQKEINNSNQKNYKLDNVGKEAKENKDVKDNIFYSFKKNTTEKNNSSSKNSKEFIKLESDNKKDIDNLSSEKKIITISNQNTQENILETNKSNEKKSSNKLIMDDFIKQEILNVSLSKDDGSEKNNSFIKINDIIKNKNSNLPKNCNLHNHGQFISDDNSFYEKNQQVISPILNKSSFCSNHRNINENDINFFDFSIKKNVNKYNDNIYKNKYISIDNFKTRKIKYNIPINKKSKKSTNIFESKSISNIFNKSNTVSNKILNNYRILDYKVKKLNNNINYFTINYCDNKNNMKNNILDSNHRLTNLINGKSNRFSRKIHTAVQPANVF